MLIGDWWKSTVGRLSCLRAHPRSGLKNNQFPNAYRHAEELARCLRSNVLLHQTDSHFMQTLKSGWQNIKATVNITLDLIPFCWFVGKLPLHRDGYLLYVLQLPTGEGSQGTMLALETTSELKAIEALSTFVRMLSEMVFKNTFQRAAF